MSLIAHEVVNWSGRGWQRRQFLQTVLTTAACGSGLGLRNMLGLKAAELQQKQRSVIVLWMAGGPSQMETFDPKPKHENGGGTDVISTRIPGIKIASGWEKTAQLMDECAILRSITNKEGNHRRATYQLHTGYVPSGSVKHPSLGSNVVQQIASPDLEIPRIVSVGKPDGLSAGFLGVDYEPFFVRDPSSMPDHTAPATSRDRQASRLYLLEKLQHQYADRGAVQVVNTHNRIYSQANRMVNSNDLNAFDIRSETDELKAAYGSNPFGEGCLLARRLVERGVSYVEVVSNGWDTHADNFEQTTALAGVVDPAMATLITDLKQRGLLDSTLIVWMGEFGRTPRVNPRGGRDHFPRISNALLAGAGIKGGQVIGSTADDGNTITDRPVTVADLFHSICQALQVNPEHENMSPLGRPMKIVEGGQVIPELFA